MRSLSIVFALILFPSAARAQDAPLFEMRGAFGAAHYLHGDLDYTAPAMLLSLRLGTPAIAIEPEYGFARHESRDAFSSAVNTERRTFQNVGVNVIRRWSGAASPYVGGGLGAYWEDVHFETHSPGGNVVLDRTNGPRSGAQVVGGVDVRATSWLTIFGQARYEMRSFQDPGGGSVIQGFGGVAVGLR